MMSSLWELTLWTQFTGFPLHFWLEQMMRSIGDKLGHVHDVDELDAHRSDFIPVSKQRPR